jgi:hypothetical protein
MSTLYNVAAQLACDVRQERPADRQLERVVSMVIEEMKKEGAPAIDRLACHDGPEAD